MSARFNLVLSDDLNQAIDAVVEESETTKSEIFAQGTATLSCGPRGYQAWAETGLDRPDNAAGTNGNYRFVTDSPKFLDIESTPPGHSYTA